MNCVLPLEVGIAESTRRRLIKSKVLGCCIVPIFRVESQFLALPDAEQQYLSHLAQPSRDRRPCQPAHPFYVRSLPNFQRSLRGAAGDR